MQTVFRTPVLTYGPGVAGHISNFGAGTGETVDGKIPGGCEVANLIESVGSRFSERPYLKQGEKRLSKKPDVNLWHMHIHKLLYSPTAYAAHMHKRKL